MVRIWPEIVELGPGGLGRLREVARALGETPLVLSGPSRSRRIAEGVLEPDVLVENSTALWVERVLGLLGDRDLIVGIGGGKVVDVAKMASFRAKIPFLSVPTVLSGDGIASPIAVIEGKSHRTEVPRALICDLEVVATAPPRHLAAGAGDLLANISSVWDWNRAHELARDEDYNAMASAMAEAGAVSLLEAEPSLKSLDFLRVLAQGLLLSGAAMALAGSSKPASGSEHKISHAMDRLFGSRGLHGEQVALGAVFTTYLQKNPKRPDLIRMLRKLGLATIPEDLGLSRRDFASCVENAPSTRPDRFTILEELAPRGSRLLGLMDEAFDL